MSAFQLFIISISWSCVVAITRDDLYMVDTGSAAQLPSGDDVISQRVGLSPAFNFFGAHFTDIYISTNGLISLDTSEENYADPLPFPTSGKHLIAPFWGDVDTSFSGSITYGSNTDSATLETVGMQIGTAFPFHGKFTPSFMFIVTWRDVGYYNFRQITMLLNTFQCILAADSEHSFLIFQYPENGIQWTAGELHGDNGHTNPSDPSSTAAIAGFNFNGSIFETLPNSGTDDIVNLTTTSNVGNPGVWIFKVDEPEMRIGIRRNGTTTAGNSHNLSCTVTLMRGLEATPTVMWVDSNGVAIGNNSLADVTVSRPSLLVVELTFAPLRTSHGGVYNCVINVEVGDGGTSFTNRSSVNITVQIPVPELTTVVLDDAVAGTRISLVGTVSLDPLVDTAVSLSAKWTRQGETQSSSTTNVTILTFAPLSSSDADDYVYTVTVSPTDPTYVLANSNSATLSLAVQPHPWAYTSTDETWAYTSDETLSLTIGPYSDGSLPIVGGVVAVSAVVILVIVIVAVVHVVIVRRSRHIALDQDTKVSDDSNVQSPLCELVFEYDAVANLHTVPKASAESPLYEEVRKFPPQGKARELLPPPPTSTTQPLASGPGVPKLAPCLAYATTALATQSSGEEKAGIGVNKNMIAGDDTEGEYESMTAASSAMEDAGAYVIM